MAILLALAPFIVFASVLRMVSVEAGLVAAAVTALLVAGRDLARGRPVKVLEVGAVILFGALALATRFGAIAWTIAGVRLVVDSGLLAIALVSLAIGRPFTLQIAREQVPPELWSSPAFFRANRTIMAVWAAAFAVLVAADASALFLPQVPVGADVAATVGALAAAIAFTRRYPARAQASAGVLPSAKA